MNSFGDLSVGNSGQGDDHGRVILLLNLKEECSRSSYYSIWMALREFVDFTECAIFTKKVCRVVYCEAARLGCYFALVDPF